MSNFEIFNLIAKDFYEVIVIGGGTCGLAVTSRLCETLPGSIYTEDEHQRFHWLKQRGNNVNLINHKVSSKTKFKLAPLDRCYMSKKNFSPEEMLVLDTVSDRFMAQWDNQFESCQIPFLRSPMFFHPDPVNVDGLYNFAHFSKRDNEKDLKEIKNVVGREFSKHRHKNRNKKHSQTIPIPNKDLTHDRSGIIDIDMRDWRDYYRPSTSLFKDFCKDIVDRYNLHDVVQKDEVIDVKYGKINIVDTNESGLGFCIETISGKRYGCKFCIVASGHRGKINFKADTSFPEGSCHTTHLFSKVTNFPHERILKGIKDGNFTSAVIVGGGLTSAQIANVLINSGVDRVYLLLRGPLKIKHFDFHLDWVTKYKNVKKSAFYIKDTDKERLQMIQEAREGGSINPEYHRIIQTHIKNKKLELLKYTEIIRKNWDKYLKKWDLTIETRMPSKSDISKPKVQTELSQIDYIYFATGITQDLKSLPFLNSIQEKHPTKLIGGYPCLTDNLQWNDELPLFMLGKNAALKMGPSSANLDGARLGAERIGWFIQDQRFSKKWAYGDDCNCSWHESLYSSSDELEVKLDENTEDNSDGENLAFETRLKLATGQLNWFSLLEEK